MDELKRVAWSAIDRSATSLQSLSSKIWSKPELNFQEHEAHALLTSFLKERGFQVDEHYTLDTAFRARAGADEGVNVAVICEFDALPEIGHACGHNLIAEAGDESCHCVYVQEGPIYTVQIAQHVLTPPRRARITSSVARSFPKGSQVTPRPWAGLIVVAPIRPRSPEQTIVSVQYLHGYSTFPDLTNSNFTWLDQGINTDAY